MSHDSLRFAIEEEFFLVDPMSGELTDAFDFVFPFGAPEGIVPEVWGCQAEILTVSPCYTVEDLREDIDFRRALLVEIASQRGIGVAANSTHPFSDLGTHRLRLPENELGRFQRLAQRGKTLPQQTIVSGMHVHVHIDDYDEERSRAKEILNRTRRDVYTLLALSANSPFVRGADGGLASHRMDEYHSYPPDYTYNVFEHYQGLRLPHMLETKPTHFAKWDVRLSDHLPTIEIRTPDVQYDLDDALMIAALGRAIVRTAAAEVDARIPEVTYPVKRLAAAKKFAVRQGLNGRLLDVESNRLWIANEYIVQSFLPKLEYALRETGDWDFVLSRLHQLLMFGGGAQRQRELFETVRLGSGDHAAWYALVENMLLQDKSSVISQAAV